MARLHVRLTPKSTIERVDGWDTDEQGRTFLKVRVRAAPIEGRANVALLAFLSKALDLPKSKLSLISGDTARLKTIDIDGLSDAELLERLK